MSTLHQRAERSSALGLEKVLVLGVIVMMVIVAAVFVVWQVGGSTSTIRACLSSPVECAGTNHSG
jgi:hypothetical protein